MATRKIILILSGEISSGKTTVANHLQKEFGFKSCKTKEGIQHFAIRKLKGQIPSREFLQEYGEQLDRSNKGEWVLKYFQDLFGNSFASNDYYIVDSARILQQIDHFRKAYGSAIVHVHLKASKKTLEERYLNRSRQDGKGHKETKKHYQQIKSNPTESKVHELENDADLVIDTDKCNMSDVFTRLSSFLKLLPSTRVELVDVIVGGQFGSEGKGQIAAYLAPEYDCLVRVGGPNAGHSVFEFPEKDVFHLLPSGTRRNPNACLIMAPGSVINLDRLLQEIQTFKVEDAERLIIDENATVISERDIAYEKKLQAKIGSTAQGVGHATANNILARIAGDDKHKAKHFTKELRPYLGSSHEKLEKLYRDGKKILLEGTQGTGLSLYHGIYPFITSRDTSVSGCLSEAGISPMRVRKIVMVTRTYPIRVAGNSGPFNSIEIDWKIVAKRSGKSVKELIAKEKTTTTKRDRRVAEFSWSMFRKACELNSPSDIALTFVDYINKNNENAIRYDRLDKETRELIEEIERCSGVKVSLISTSFNYRSVLDRRNWR